MTTTTQLDIKIIDLQETIRSFGLQFYDSNKNRTRQKSAWFNVRDHALDYVGAFYTYYRPPLDILQFLHREGSELYSNTKKIAKKLCHDYSSDVYAHERKIRSDNAVDLKAELISCAVLDRVVWDDRETDEPIISSVSVWWVEGDINTINLGIVVMTDNQAFTF